MAALDLARAPAAAAAAPAVARTQPVRTQRKIVAVLKPVRDGDCTDGEYKQKAKEACLSALHEFRTDVLPVWQTEGYLHSCILPLEFGKDHDGAHLESGWIVQCTHAEEKKSVTELTEKRIRPVLNRHVAGGKIKWQIRKAHNHDNVLLMFGYRFKDHTKYETLREFHYVAINVSEAYLRAAHKAWVDESFQNNEGGESAGKVGRPGKRTVPLITKSSLLPDTELFEWTHNLEPFGFTVGKLAHLMVSEGFAQLHTMHTSGASGSSHVNAVQQNLLFQLRKRPRHAKLRAVNQLLYGMDYDDKDDAAVAAAIEPMRGDNAPPLSQALKLSWVDVMTAQRTGALPTGELLDPELRGYVGRATVVSLANLGAALESVRIFSQLQLLTQQRVRPAALVAPKYTVAATARLLAASSLPFGVDENEAIMCCTTASLVTLANAMLYLDEGQAHDLTNEQMVSFIDAIATEEVSTSLPWLAREPSTNVRIHGVVGFAHLAATVRVSLAEYVRGRPQLHVAIVHAPSEQAHFAVAWQLSTPHMAGLAAAIQTAAPANMAPPTHQHATNDVLARARGARTGAP